METEAARCLCCKKARCSMGCPVHTDIPGCTRLYREGKADEAGRILFENNPMSVITSQVCDWSKFCFGHCVLNHKKIPINWHPLEKHLSEEFLFHYHPLPPAENGKRVAVIGAGPAGIAAAIWLREAGCAVTLFDGHSTIGGVLKYGIPEFRLDHRFINEFGRILDEYGIAFKGGIRVGQTRQLAGIRRDFDATLIATGAQKPRTLQIPGEADNPHILYAIEFLEHPEAYDLQGKVLVIGGGNVTMDACRTALRKGCETWVYYRKTFENMPANRAEVQEALAEGVHFEMFEVPVEIVDGQTAIMRKCENRTDENGKVYTAILEGTDHAVHFDTLIVAISDQMDYSLFGPEMPEVDASGRPVLNEDQQTSFPDVFLAGDFVTGPQTVVHAVASAKTAVAGMLRFLQL